MVKREYHACQYKGEWSSLESVYGFVSLRSNREYALCQ